ncbi:MAG: ribose-phosphate diphosphokinase [Parachlamydiales bacterium]|jgi:ribose-phosphate pyrophosphokinase
MKKITFLILFLFSVSLYGTFENVSPKEMEKDSIKFFSGTSNPILAKDVASILGINLSQANIGKYNDGEIRIELDENVSGKNVYILQSICSTKQSSVNDNLVELMLMIRACKRANADKIIVVLPYFGYARQDRKTHDYSPISASDISMILEDIGADQVITLDLHCSQIQGFFHNISVLNLKTSIMFVPYFERKGLNELVVVAPDAGALNRARSLIDGLNQYGINARLSLIVKHRLQPGVVDKISLIGEVKGCDVIMIDDICDTGETLVQAAKALKIKGANKIYACVTHPIFSKNAIEKIENSDFEQLIITDTIPLKQDISSKIVQISMAPLIAETIKRVQNKEPITYLFNY